MKISSIAFVAFIFLIALNYTKVLKTNIYIMIGAGCLCFIIFYIEIHIKNKEMNAPKPVYMVN